MQRERRILAGAEQSVVDQLVEARRLIQASEVAARILTDEEVHSFVGLHAEALLELHAVEQVCACSRGCRSRR